MTKPEHRILMAIEMGMRNHEWVPMTLIERISRTNRGKAFKLVKNILKQKLIKHTNKKYDGYQLKY
jgi:RIO kinase 2